MASDTGRKWLKYSLITFGVIVGLLLVAYLVLILVLPSKVDIAMRKALANSLGDEYTLGYDDLDISIFAGDISLDSISIIRSTEKSAKPLDSLKVERLAVSGVNLWKFIFDKKLKIGSITIERPVVWAQIPQMKDTTTSDSSGGKGGKPFSSLSLEKFKIVNGSLLMRNQGDTLHSFKELDFNLATLHWEPSGDTAATLLDGISWKGTDLSLQNHVFKTRDGLYRIQLAGMTWDSDIGKLLVSELNVTPRPAKFEFHEIVGHQTDRMTVSVKKVSANGIDLQTMVREGNYKVNTLQIDGMSLHSFRDKRFPYPEVYQSKMPKAILNRLPLKLTIDTVKLKDARVAYEEYPAKGSESGMIFFSQLNATIERVSTDPAVTKGHSMKLSASALAMGKGQMEAYADFPYDQPAGQHTVNGSMGEMDLSAFNTMLIPNKVRIDQGRALNLTFSFEATDEVAKGQAVLLYENLKISLPGTEKGSFVKDLLGDLAEAGLNAVVIKDNNPKDGEPPRKGEIDFERDKRKSIFNYWWYSLKSGLMYCIANKTVLNIAESTQIMPEKGDVDLAGKGASDKSNKKADPKKKKETDEEEDNEEDEDRNILEKAKDKVKGVFD